MSNEERLAITIEALDRIILGTATVDDAKFLADELGVSNWVAVYECKPEGSERAS
jgi:hypothetical protein